MSATPLWTIGVVILGTLIGAWGPILFKKGSKKFTIDPRKILRNPLILIKNYYVITGCAVYALSAFVTIPALGFGDLSVLYPVSSLTYVWVALLSMKFLKEKMNSMKWLGILAIIIGVSLIGIGHT
jgi:uncharacterized membrane protein